MDIRSLKSEPEVCWGCKQPLGQNRVITVDKFGNPVRFNIDCACYTRWVCENVSDFVRNTG